LTLILSFSLSFLNAQTQKEVDDNIFVTFPVSPEYKLTTEASTYISKTANCMFMVIIQRNAIPNYVQYVNAKQNWTAAEIEKVESSFLDNAVKGRLQYSENQGTSKPIKVGKYSGREIYYSAINPATGERGNRFSHIFLVRDKAISFEVWLLNNSLTANQEKDKFLNSITVKPSNQETSVSASQSKKEVPKSPAKSFSTPKSTTDNQSASKSDTEEWILSKLRSYAPESYDVPIDRKNSYSGTAWIVKDISFSFDDYNLEINYSHAQPNRFGVNNYNEDKVFYKVSIPLYAVTRVYSVSNDLWFSTNENVIIEENVTKAKKSTTSWTSVPFYPSSETDLVKRLEKAILHLKKFYSKPKNKEIF